VHTSLPEDTPCTTDGSSCTTNDRCKDDDNNPNTPRKCRGDGTFCFENNPCASHDCEGDACPANPTFLPNDTQCSTGDVCKLDQTCQSGVCTGGTDVPQDDFNPCTIDGCNPVTGVFHIAVGNSATVLCDDADPCTQNDKCDGDVCEGTPITCTPLDSCHKAGSCNSEDGTCSDPRQPDGTTCETTGKCETGVCVGGSVVEPGEGGAGGEPSNATGGDNGTGNETSTGGENASGGTAGEGATSSGGSAGTETDPNKQGGIYARDPGGCSCSVPGASNERRAGGALGLLFLAGAALLRRRRAA
jgi:MYXO-CTERM domain-containing protein